MKRPVPNSTKDIVTPPMAVNPTLSTAPQTPLTAPKITPAVSPIATQPRESNSPRSFNDNKSFNENNINKKPSNILEKTVFGQMNPDQRETSLKNLQRQTFSKRPEYQIPESQRSKLNLFDIQWKNRMTQRQQKNQETLEAPSLEEKPQESLPETRGTAVVEEARQTNIIKPESFAGKFYTSPVPEMLGDKAFTTLTNGVTYIYVTNLVKTPLQKTGALMMHNYDAGEAGRNIGVAHNLGTHQEFVKANGLNNIDMTTVCPPGLVAGLPEATKKILSNIKLKKTTNGDEIIQMKLANEPLDYKFEYRGDTPLKDAEKDFNMSGNVNPDLSMRLPDLKNPGKKITVFFDCKNIAGPFQDYNHLRSFPRETIEEQTLNALGTEVFFVNNALPHLPKSEIAQGHAFLDDLEKCKTEWANTKDRAALIANYNNLFCKYAGWLLDNRIPFNMTVECDVDKFVVDPHVKDQYRELRHGLATDEELPLIPYLKYYSANRTKGEQVTETSLIKEFFKLFQNVKPPEDGF